MRRQQILDLIKSMKLMVNLFENNTKLNESKLKEIKEQVAEAESRIKSEFPITSVSKDDIRQAYLDIDGGVPEDAEECIQKLTDFHMERIASKLSDDYCNQLFWTSVIIIFENFLDEYKAGKLKFE